MATMATSCSSFIRSALLVVGLATLAALAAPTSHVASSVCYQIRVQKLPEPSTPVLARGIGLVEKYLIQAADLMHSYRGSMLKSDRLHNKTLPDVAKLYQLPQSLTAVGTTSLTDLFHRLAVSCLLFERLANEEVLTAWSTQLHGIKDELVESLCHMHYLLRLTSNRISNANLKVITELFRKSLELPRVSHADREWHYFRDYAIAGAVHEVAKRSIRELSEAKDSWVKLASGN